MSKILIIGCGGVAQVAIQKCAMCAETFTEICIASRTVSKCDALKEKLQGKTSAVITTEQVDADNVEELIALINRVCPDAVLNLALPYQDLTIMDACLACKVDYIDTANYEAEDTEDPVWRAIYEKRCKEEGFTAYFDYSWQWAYKERFEEAGITALLGSGFDPGVTSVFSVSTVNALFSASSTTFKQVTLSAINFSFVWFFMKRRIGKIYRKLTGIISAQTKRTIQFRLANRVLSKTSVTVSKALPTALRR